MQGFVADHVAPGAKVYTDTAGGYHGMTGFDHESKVNHNVGEYVRAPHRTASSPSGPCSSGLHKGTFPQDQPEAPGNAM